MTSEQLQGRSKKELIELARKKGVAGWHGMRKEELIAALGALSSRPAAAEQGVNGHTHGNARPVATAVEKPAQVSSRPPARPRPQTSAARNTSGEEAVESSKYELGVPTRDLSTKLPRDLPGGYGKDRIVVMVRDPYWLHAYWEISRHAIQRAEAALGQAWHGARPILRLLDVTCTEMNAANAESILRDIDIHGGCNNWYIDVNNPPRSYRVDIGYLAKNGQFYVLARSNVVNTPRAGMSDVIDENWADIDTKKADRIYAMSGGFDPNASSLELKQLFEERLRRPMGSPAVSSFGSGAFLPSRQRKFWFQLDAELIVYGATEPSAHVTLQGQPVKLRPDGTFTMRFSLPDCRQIIPATANSADGVEERTIVLAVERNTKQLEPMIYDGNE